MAEICCGVATGSDPSAETSPRSARRRRMELRRFRFVSEAEPQDLHDDEMKLKRQRLNLKNLARNDPCSDETAIESKETAVIAAGIESRSIPVADPAPSSVRFGVTSVCGRRRDMEDAVSVHRFSSTNQGERFHFFGVFDGHGCSHVADSCKNRMHELVAEEIDRLGSGAPPPSASWRELMERSFTRMDADALRWSRSHQKVCCRCELLMPKCNHVGSTAVVAVVTAEETVVANCGDSRAVLCRKGVPVPLSVDHKPDRPDELDRIEAAGGRVIFWEGARVLGVLAMSRAIGDSYLKPFVIPEPEVTVTERTADDECLIIASDGLWDVVTNEMACNIVRICLQSNVPPAADVAGGSDKACADAAMLLTKLALARQSSDNVSVVVVDLRTNRR